MNDEQPVYREWPGVRRVECGRLLPIERRGEDRRCRPCEAVADVAAEVAGRSA